MKFHHSRKYCPNGHQIDDGRLNYCPECGMPLYSAPTDQSDSWNNQYSSSGKYRKIESTKQYKKPIGYIVLSAIILGLVLVILELTHVTMLIPSLHETDSETGEEAQVNPSNGDFWGIAFTGINNSMENISGFSDNFTVGDTIYFHMELMGNLSSEPICLEYDIYMNDKKTAVAGNNYLSGNGSVEKFEYNANEKGIIRIEVYYHDKADNRILLGNASAEIKPKDTPIPTQKPMEIWSSLTFGRYEQDNILSNGPETIEWIVLDYDEANHKALLISKYGLDAKPYNNEFADVTWEICTLRAWLNGEFLNKAFSEEEQEVILLTEVDNSLSQGYSEWNTDGGNNTCDKIFLLSYLEAARYFSITDHYRSDMVQAAPTDYAVAHGAYINQSIKTDGGKAVGYWWLRSPGYYQYYAARMDTVGSLRYNHVNHGNIVVRPAFWLNLESGLYH